MTVTGEIIQVVVAVLLLLNCWLAYRARAGVEEVSKDMAQLEKNTNSKMDTLLELTAKSSKAEGLKEGRDEAKP